MAKPDMSPIDQQWVKKYVDSLLEAAKSFGPESVMGQGAMVRADAVMDLVTAWRERNSDKYHG